MPISPTNKTNTACHSPLPDWIADVGELAMAAGMAVRQNSQKGTLVFKL